MSKELFGGEIIGSKCLICKSEIALNAAFCIHCSKYQSRWKRIPLAVSGLVGLVTAAAAFIVFLVTSYPKLDSVLFPRKEISVLSFSSHGDLVISNTGNIPVFIESVVGKIKINEIQNASLTMRINKLIQPGITSTFPAGDNRLTMGLTHGYAEDFDPESWEKILKKVRLQPKYKTDPKTGIEKVMDNTDCFLLSLTHSSDHHWVGVKKRLGTRLKVLKATAELRKYSHRGGSFSKHIIPVDGFVLRRSFADSKNDECIRLLD